MSLNDLVLQILDHAVSARKSGVCRFLLDGVPREICKHLVSVSSQSGLCGYVVVWFSGKSGGESLPESWWFNRKSAKLDDGGVMIIRNRQVDFLVLKEAETADPNDSIGRQVVTVIPDLINDVEISFLSLESPGQYIELCNKCSGSDVHADLSSKRWKYLQVHEALTSQGWEGYLGLSAALGVPSEAEGELIPTVENFKTLEDIATFIKERPSPGDAKEQLIEIIETYSDFQPRERYKEAIEDFFNWLVDTDSWKVTSNWNRPSIVYRVKDLPIKQSEKNWRLVLDRNCWNRLLKPFAKASRQMLEVRNSHDPEAQLVMPLADGAWGAYPVSVLSQLCVSATQSGQKILVPADWKLGLKPAVSVDSINDLVLVNCDDDVVRELFKSRVLVRAKTSDKTFKGSLINLSLSDFGVFVFVDGAELEEEIEQPQPNDVHGDASTDLIASMVLKHPGAFSLVLLIDPQRLSLPETVRIDDKSFNFQSVTCQDGSIRIDVIGIDSDGILQRIDITFRDANRDELHLLVDVTCAGLPEGEYGSYLHLWAASHADKKKYPNAIFNKYGEKLEPILRIFEQMSSDGKPLFIGAIDDGEDFLSDLKVMGNGVILDKGALRIGAENSAMVRSPNWKLPQDVKSARNWVWSLLRLIAGDRPFSNVDFTNPQLSEAFIRYRDSFDCWIKTEPDAAYDALSWIDTVHFVSNTTAGPKTLALIVLPTHPLSLLGIMGLSEILSPKRSSDKSSFDFYPPLSRLYGMAGPRSWVTKCTDSTHEVYKLATPNEHIFKVYEKTGPVNESIRGFFKSRFDLGLPTHSLSLGTRDVVSVLDDVCALNPAMSNFKVGIVSDPSGSVCEGIFSWFKETDSSMSPESKDWSNCFPMHLSVYSASSVISDWDVEGRVANCSDSGERKLSWYKGLPGECPDMNFSILGELECGEDSADMGEGRGLVSSLSLYRLGACFRQDFMLQPESRKYIDTYGSGYISEAYNFPSQPGAPIGRMLERWEPVLRRNHKPYTFSETPVTVALKDSNFVAIPVSTSSIIQAVLAIDADSAVWKFEHTEFGVTDSTSGHVILTKRLEILHQRMKDISTVNKFTLDGNDEIASLLRYMGRAGINTLHSLSDNEKVLLGALSSVAVMRTFDSIPRSVPRISEGAWPSLVMPLDSFSRLLNQLNKNGSRPNFLVIEVNECPEGRFDIRLDVLEAKWRSDGPRLKHLISMHKDQCMSFVDEMKMWFSIDGDASRRMSGIIFVSELITAAIKLRESSSADPDFSGERGVSKSLSVTDALLNNKVNLSFGTNPMLICVSGDDEVVANTLIESEEFSGCVGVMRQCDAISSLKDPCFQPTWYFKQGGLGPDDPLSALPLKPLGGPSDQLLSTEVEVDSFDKNEKPVIVTKLTGKKDISEVNSSENLNSLDHDSTEWPPVANSLGLVGQNAASIKVKNKSTMSVRLGRRFTDTLFVGPAGVGKSSFARAIAAEVLKEEPIFSSGSDAETPGDLISLLGSRGKIPPMKGRRKVAKCVVFIDEIHALSKKTSVFLLSALDDARLATEDGIEYDFNDVVFLGATTDKGCLTPAFLSRMDVIQLIPYSIAELAGILYVHGKRVFGGYELSRDVCEEIAIRSRCNPRKAVRNLENDMLAHLLSLVPVELDKDEALKEAGRLMTTSSVSEYYQSQGVDLNGLDQTSIKALKYLEKTESASREKLRKGLQITNEADFNEVMEYLEVLRLVSTSTNGRSITNEGRKYLKAPASLRRFM